MAMCGRRWVTDVDISMIGNEASEFDLDHNHIALDEWVTIARDMKGRGFLRTSRACQ